MTREEPACEKRRTRFRHASAAAAAVRTNANCRARLRTFFPSDRLRHMWALRDRNHTFSVVRPDLSHPLTTGLTRLDGAAT